MEPDWHYRQIAFLHNWSDFASLMHNDVSCNTSRFEKLVHFLSFISCRFFIVMKSIPYCIPKIVIIFPPVSLCELGIPVMHYIITSHNQSQKIRILSQSFQKYFVQLGCAAFVSNFMNLSSSIFRLLIFPHQIRTNGHTSLNFIVTAR